jgi:hypothetical protein
MPYAIEVENSLRGKIGANVSLGQLFSQDRIKECEQLIAAAHNDFLREARDMLGVMTRLYDDAAAEPKEMGDIMGHIAQCAFSVKALCENLGFSLGFEVARSLYDYGTRMKQFDAAKLVVIRKHLDVLAVVLGDEMKGDGGALGREMQDSLALLVKKIPA